MTEQEKRDKAFYPMIMTAYPLGADYPEVAAIQRLINAGYRKADEVRKETAKEILTTIASDFYSIGDDIFELTKHDIQELMQKFGVEVEG